MEANNPPRPLSAFMVGTGLDPQQDYFYDSFELFRCCLLRTLLSYNGMPTDKGGTGVQPDLATRMPDVSGDGLTWTFHLKAGLHYAPPFASTAITSKDVVTALEREANPKVQAPYTFYYSVIQGFDAFSSGKARSIAGLETPDDTTLVVHLTQPTGDFGYRMSLPAAAPLPPGAATGHDSGYGRFLVSSGPYMIAGSPALDFSRPPAQQRPVAGYVPAKSLDLVRNPSWRPSTDSLRPAYPDRIHVAIGGTIAQAARAVAAGRADLTFYPGPPPQLPTSLIRRYEQSPKGRSRLLIGPRDGIAYVSMNLAMPPFDDVHVRRAVNYAVDKAAILRLRGFASGQITGHVLIDSLEDNLLLRYDAFATPGDRGSLSKARAEMRLSGHDPDHDGRCDGPACRGLLALAKDVPPYPRVGDSIRRDLARIGIDLAVRDLPTSTYLAVAANPRNHVAMTLTSAWAKDYPNGNQSVGLFSDGGIAEGSNYSLISATPTQLRKWGYRVRSVPNLQGRIQQCVPLLGADQVRCWAALDQYVTDVLVPQVPVESEYTAQLLSTRVVSGSFDQFQAFPALDRFALRQG